MCGRFTLAATPEELEDFLAALDLEPPPPRYNIAPTQPILIVMAGSPGPEGSNLPARRALLARWGLIPSWTKDPADLPLLFNARSETAASKPAFRGAMRHWRVLVPASGFYEWRKAPKGSKEKSQPYFVRPRDGGLIAFAGIMDHWLGADGSELDTAAILTTAASEPFSDIHPRIPVVVPREEFSRWLDCTNNEPKDVADLLAPPPDDLFEAIPISDRVNKVANSGPDIQEPVAPVVRAESNGDPERKAKKKGAGGQPAQLKLF